MTKPGYFRIATAAIMSLTLLAVASPAFAGKKGGGQFSDGLYGGCATKSELYSIMRRAGLKPMQIRFVAGGYVLIRGKDPKEKAIYDYAVLPCLFMVDGRSFIRYYD